jgi:hypothetical protein
MFEEVGTDNSQLLYYRTMSLIELSLSEVEEQWEKNNIPQKYIIDFNRMHKLKVEMCTRKIRNICFSDETKESKEQQIMDSIRIIIYQTIFDAHKGIRRSE